jgi:hypothetical protein
MKIKFLGNGSFKKKAKTIVTFFIVIIIFQACEQSDPPPFTPVISTGDLQFSGISWRVKSSGAGKLGPGPNYFSDSTKNVFVDNQGYLHLKITKEGNTWQCAEVISIPTYGYGTYVFSVASNVADIDKNVVMGFFTWDSAAFYTQANSEVDIEFAKWGASNDSLTLTYSVQPVWFSNPVPYYERSNRPVIPVSKLKNPSVHAFKWTDTLITWNSYEGTTYPGTNLISSWFFDDTNIPRVKIEGGNQSQPIVIPAPGGDVHARINLWLLNGLGPSNNQDVELIVKEFKFIPL